MAEIFYQKQNFIPEWNRFNQPNLTNVKCPSWTPGISPTTTVYAFGSGFLSTQWAAVNTQSGLIRDPPQICPPRELRREICQGQEWGLASSPLITRAKGGRMPHPEEWKMEQQQ